MMLKQRNHWWTSKLSGFTAAAMTVAVTVATAGHAAAQETPLAFAVSVGDVDLVEYLIARGDDIEAQSRNGRTPLQVAASVGDAEMVRALIEHGANVDPQPSSPRQSPLRLATEAGHRDVVSVLLANGADATPHEWPASFPLYIAVENGDYDMAELLLERSSADVNTVVEGCPKDSPLDVAIDSGNLRMVTLLLRHGGDVDRVDLYGLVRRNGFSDESAELLGLLVSEGMDINRPFGQYPPLHRAAGHGAINAMEALLEHGADVDATNDAGDTALHVAVRSNRIDVVEFLVARGANVDARNNEGWTPRDLIAASSPIAESLRQQGSRPQP